MIRLLVITIALLATGCTQTSSTEDSRPFVSVTFAYGARSLGRPVSPQDGCDEGCQCNGTGEERSGDGLAIVACRCPDTCDCKQRSELIPEEAEACEDGSCTPVSPAPTTYRSGRFRLFRRR